MIVALQPSYWQQVAAGLVVIIPTLIIGALLLGWFSRSVLEPRAAGRRWPEGARGVRGLVEIVVDSQRRIVPDAGDPGRPERLARLQALRFGLVVATCAVVPLSTGLVLTQPNLGLYALAILIGFDAAIEWFAVPDSERVASDTQVRVGLAALIGLMAGVVHAQWGTGSLAAVVSAQADAAVGGTAVWGLPTMFVHPLAASVAVLAAYATLRTMATTPATRTGGLPALLAGVVNRSWVIALSAWLVAAFAGGGAVPWAIDNPGTRQAVSVVVFSTKVALVTIAFAWACATWPTVSLRFVRALLGLGMVVGAVAITLTLLVRHLV